MSDEKLKVGPYRVVALLGRGGMGAVYHAKHDELGREVALKVLTLGAADDEMRVARFRREAEAAMQLTHPGVVRVYDYGTDAGRQYLAMELVHGATLREVLDRTVTMPVPESTSVAAQLLEALGACHAIGVLHRDVKPANIMLEASGKARLLDLGLVKQVDRTVLTAEGSVVGTPRYMPPEMLAAAEVDHRGDIYQVGAVLYECLAGRPVADAVGLMDVVEQVLNGPPPPMPEVLEKGPRGVREFLSRALAKNPDDRFESCAQAVAVLRGMQSSGRLKRSASSDNLRLSGEVLPQASSSARTPVSGVAPRRISQAMQVNGATPAGGLEGPRPLPPGVKLLVYALTAGLGVAGLVTAVALSRRSTVVTAQESVPASAAAPKELVVATGPAELRVEWRTERPVRGTVALPAIGRTEREDVARVAHRVVVDRLVPETRYELAVGDDEGSPPLTHTVVTRSVAGVVRELTRVLEAADPGGMISELRQVILNPFKDKRGKVPEEWRAKLRQRFGNDEYLQAAMDWVSVKHLLSEADVPVVARQRLLQRLHDLEDLHEAIEMGLKFDSGLKPRELFPAGLQVEEKLPEGPRPLVAVRFGPAVEGVQLPPAKRVIEAGEPMVFNQDFYNLLTSDPKRRTRKTYEIAGPLTTAKRLERVYLGFRACQGLPVEKVLVWGEGRDGRALLGRIPSTRGSPPPERYIRLDERPVADPTLKLYLTFSNRDLVLTGLGVKVFSLVLYGEHP